jgi:hypothetical protein
VRLSVEQVTEVLSEVNMLKDRQEDTDSKLETMKMENEALWQEVRLLPFYKGVRLHLVNWLFGIAYFLEINLINLLVMMYCLRLQHFFIISSYKVKLSFISIYCGFLIDSGLKI